MADANKTDTEPKTKTEDDDELSELLDSALKDLTSTTDNKDSNKKTETIETVKPTPPDSLWNEEYLKATATRFEQNMASLFSPGPDGTLNMDQLGERLSQIADASSQAAGFGASPDNEFSAIIANTLRGLSENAENIPQSFNDEDLMNMLGSLGDGNDSGDFLPFMKKMMQTLLSKEILHPALSNIVEKYPAWLEENKTKLTGEELAKYEKQLSLMRQVCVELDSEQPDDSEAVKVTRFDKVLVLMQEMQDCGVPPAELTGDTNIFNDLAQPQLPPGMSPEQCCIM